MVLFGLLFSVSYMTKDASVNAQGYMTLRRYGYGWGGTAGSFQLSVRDTPTLVTVEGRVDREGGTLSSVIPLARLLELTHVSLASSYSGDARALTLAVLSVTRSPAGPGEVWPTAVFTTPLGAVRLYGPEIRTDSDRVLTLLGMPPLPGSNGSAVSGVSAWGAAGGGGGGRRRRLADGSGGGAEWASLGSGGASGFFQVDVSPGGELSKAWLATPTPSGTPSSTGSTSLSPSGSGTPLFSPTPSLTGSPTRSSSKTPTGSGSVTPPGTPTRSISRSGTTSDSGSLTPSPSATTSPTASTTPSGSLTSSGTPTPSASATGSVTPTSTPTGSMTPTSSATATQSPSGTPTPTPTTTATGSATATPSPTGSTSLTASGTATPSASPTASLTASGSATASATASASPTASLTASGTGTPPPTPSATGSAVPTCNNVAYRRALDPTAQSAAGSSGGSGGVTLGSANAGTPSMYACAGGDGSGGQGFPTDYWVINIGAAPVRGGVLTLSTCGSDLDTVLFYGGCAGASSGAVSAGDFTCAAAADDTCGSGSQLAIPGVTGQFHQVGVSGFGNATGGYVLSWRYDEPVTPSGTPPGTPSNSATPSGTPPATATPSGTASSSLTASGTPSSTGTPTPSVTPTVSAVNTCSGYPFRSLLSGTSGVTPVLVNNASNVTRLFGCPGSLDPYVPYWFNASGPPTPADFFMLDLGADTCVGAGAARSRREGAGGGWLGGGTGCLPREIGRAHV